MGSNSRKHVSVFSLLKVSDNDTFLWDEIKGTSKSMLKKTVLHFLLIMIYERFV